VRILFLMSCIVGVAAYIGYGVKSLHHASPYAIVFVDEESRRYFAPFCVSGMDRDRMVKMSLGEAQDRSFVPDDGCRNTGAFVQEGRSLTGNVLQRLGILGPIESRWKPDGSWRW